MVDNTGRSGHRGVRKRRGRGVPTAVVLALVTVLALGLSACSSGGTAKPKSTGTTNPTVTAPTGGVTASSTATDPPAVITASLHASDAISPVTPVALSVANGKLTSAKLVNPAGKAVTGALAANGSGWHTTEVLGYSKTYRLTATAENAAGTATTKKLTFSTITPANMTAAYLDTVYGSPIQNGATYGVGMIPVVHFDEQITDRKAAEKALTVTTSPHVDGSWYWPDGQNVHWRPKNFYAPGTKVTVAAHVYGVQVGAGLYGQSDQSVSFRIGAKHIAIASAQTHQVKVYVGDKLVRTMPTSMGQGGYVQGKNGQIALWTMPGTYTVLGYENPAIMSSDSYGLPANSPYGYAPEKVYWSTKISTDGIYLHELDTTVWAQGHQNVSHGCLNLNYDNAKWFFTHTRVGDVVKVIQSGGPQLQEWQGGDWTVPWSTWTKGSALS